MSNRDKLIAQAEAYDGIVAYFAQFPKDRLFSAGDIVWKIRDDTSDIRAIAAQQPEAVEHPLDGPKCEHGYPLSAPSCPLCGGRPQASAPADHTAADAPNREAGSSAATNGTCQVGNQSAVGVTDLDALVAELETAGGDYRHLVLQAKCRHAITDLRALSVTHIMLDVVPGFDGCGEEIYAESVKEVEQCMSKMGIQIDEQAARITRLEAENAKARELLQWLHAPGGLGYDKHERINAFLAKGATP